MDASEHRIGVGALAHAVGTLVTPLAFTPRSVEAGGLIYRAEPQSGIQPLADVYVPDGAGPHPSVVLVHGGGFLIGSRGMKPMRFLATQLCEAGYAVATFDYRMIFRGGRLPEAVGDVRAMLAWWGEQVDRFNLDRSRISAMGLSAGATALLLATSPAPPLALQHVISVFAIYDLGLLGGRLPRILARLLTRSRDGAEWTRRSPISLPPCPRPLTMLHGTADGLTHYSQAELFLAERERLGLKTRLHIYEGAPHGFFNDATSAVATQAMGDVLAALEANKVRV